MSAEDREIWKDWSNGVGCCMIWREIWADYCWCVVELSKILSNIRERVTPTIWNQSDGQKYLPFSRRCSALSYEQIPGGNQVTAMSSPKSWHESIRALLGADCRKRRERATKIMSVWFDLVLWHINLCRLFNAKSIFIYTKFYFNQFSFT